MQQINTIAEKKNMLAQFMTDCKVQERSKTSYDLFQALPPANESDIVNAIKTLTIAFPNMQPDFWALLTNRLKVLAFSRERLQYILHIAIDTNKLIQQYRFGRLTIADFTSITKQINFYSYNEALSNLELVWVFTEPNSTKAKITTRQEAIISGYKFEEIKR